jgi:hypothetical protein
MTEAVIENNFAQIEDINDFTAIAVGNEVLSSLSLDDALLQHPEISSEIILAYMAQQCEIDSSIYQHVLHCAKMLDIAANQT